MSSEEQNTNTEQNNDENKDNELFFGLVCPVGTNKNQVIAELQKVLSNVEYDIEKIKLTDLFLEVANLPQNFDNELPRDEYLTNRMDAGNQLRSTARDGSALVKLAFIEIAERRAGKNHEDEPVPRTAYIFDSLKHPDEVETLRRVYGKNFWLISAYSPEKIRLDTLAEEIRRTRHGESVDDFKDLARGLINRDQEESDDKYGQKVVKTFHLGDVFVDSNATNLDKSIERFTNLIFNDVEPTPTTDEYGMFYAKASAFRSASLARQVGVAIISENGDVLATGTNEVPRYGGGLCGPDNNPEQRESNRGWDSNTVRTIDLLHDFISRLKQSKWFSKERTNMDVDVLVSEIMDKSDLKNARLMDVTEYGREVHAEMAALMNASRQTIRVDGSTLFCTTFPCHVCTKHIIASGIIRAVYIEPYPKSLAKILFGDQDGLITVDQKPEDGKVSFQPFVGISPTRFMELFAWKEKKNDDGSKIEWDPKNANPRYWEKSLQILKNEKLNASDLAQKLSITDLSLTN